MEKTKSKLDMEIETAYKNGKNAIVFVKQNMDANAPSWFFAPVKRILLDYRILAFLAGMGVEAAGIAIQQMIGFPITPVIDVVTMGVLVVAIAWYQGKNQKSCCGNREGCGNQKGCACVQQDTDTDKSLD